MAITVTLVIEDGTGKADANTYASLDDFRLYWAQKIIDYSDSTVKGQSDNDLSAALITATEYIDGIRFFGERTTIAQALAFPRISLSRPGSSYVYPSYLPSDKVPAAVVKATCYMAGLIIQGHDITGPTQSVSSQSVSGIGSVTYSDGSGKWHYPVLKALLGGLVNTSLVIERAI